MNSYQPYTYLIKFILTQQLYYGVRWAKGCHPSEFWVKYFTTSKIIKALIKEHGKDSFEVLYITLHITKDDALMCEQQHLIEVDAARNVNYLNRHNGGKNFYCMGHSEDTKRKIGRSGRLHHNFGKHGLNSGKDNPMYGRNHTTETINIQREVKLGELNPMYGIIGKDNPSSKQYIITHPTGAEEFICGLPLFCKIYNLCAAHLTKVAKGKKSQHKGFKCRYATEQEVLDFQQNIPYNSVSINIVEIENE